MDPGLPIATRWTLYALGAVEGRRVRRPRDPVAAWMLRRHPHLLPSFAAPSVLAMLRARTTEVDRMIGEVVQRARAAGRRLVYWGFGGGFDARWYRLRPSLKDVVTHHGEIEAPEVLAFKDTVLTDSSFAGPWERVTRVRVDSEAWTVPKGQQDALVVLEGVATRLGISGLKRLLRRLRADAPRARVIVDLPGILQPTDHPGRAAVVSSLRSRWASPAGTTAAAIQTRELLDMGWCLHEDHWLAARPELCSASGIAICSGMEACRVLHLGPAR